MKNKKTNLLTGLQKKLKEWEIESVFKEAGKGNFPTDILGLVLEDFGSDLVEVLAEFFFMPMPEDSEDKSLYFNCVMTLTEDISEQMIPVIREAVGVVNFYTQSGCFVVSPRGDTLVYRNTCPFPEDMDEAGILSAMAEITDVSFAVAEQFVGVLLGVCAGRMSMEELRGMFPEV